MVFSQRENRHRRRYASNGRLRLTLQLALGAGQLPGDARVVATRGIHGAGKRLEQRLDDVMRFVAVE